MDDDADRDGLDEARAIGRLGGLPGGSGTPARLKRLASRLWATPSRATPHRRPPATKPGPRPTLVESRATPRRATHTGGATHRHAAERRPRLFLLGAALWIATLESLVEAEVSAVVVVVGDVIRQPPSQMTFVENDDVVEQLAADAADPSLRDAIVPRARPRCPGRLNADEVIVETTGAEKIVSRGSAGTCASAARRLAGAAGEARTATPYVPRLRGPTCAAHHGSVCSPGWILRRHSLDQVADTPICRWPPGLRPRRESQVQ